ncbi:MAG: glycosyltransferase family 2 protein [Desulfatirhabdiaceae bacterium]
MQEFKTLAIVVNYFSAGLAVEAVHSITQSESIGPVQIVVVDNSQEKSEATILQQKLPETVHLIINETNEGFGQACNRAFDQHDADMILLLNPDARLLPGALLQLQRSLLEFDRAGAVGPQIYWDNGKRFYLPPSSIPELLWFHPLISACVPLGRLVSRMWRQFAIRVWQSKTPVRVLNLSGGHVLLDRNAVAAAGGLFNPDFFLYYEDTDLFIRLRQAGYRLYIDPLAEVIHFYDQCGTSGLDVKRRLMARSYQVFMDHHTRGWKRLVQKLTAKLKPAPAISVPLSKNGYHPFEIPVALPIQKQWLFEWSPNPDFMPAAGHFGTGDTMKFPDDCWRLLAPGQYYGRLGRVSGISDRFELISWIKKSEELGDAIGICSDRSTDN